MVERSETREVKMKELDLQDVDLKEIPTNEEEDEGDIQQEELDQTEQEKQFVQGMTTKDKWLFFFAWYFLAILSHLFKGGHTSFTQYLGSSERATPPPAFSVVTYGNLFAFLLYTPRIAYKTFNYWTKSEVNRNCTTSERFNNLKDFLKQVFSKWELYAFMAVLALRAVCRSRALHYTQALFVQLVEMIVPFLITFLSVYVFKTQNEKIRWPFVATLIVTALGSLLMILGESTDMKKGFYWFPDFPQIASLLTRADLAGLFLAVLGSIALALRTIIIEYTITREHTKLSCENIFILEKVSLFSMFLLPSFFFGDVTQLFAMSGRQWAVFFIIAIFHYLIGSYLNIFAVAKLGSNTYGVLLPVRLFSMMLVAMILLGENINNFTEIMGFVIIATGLVSFMLWKKYSSSKNDIMEDPVLRASSRYRMEPFTNIRVE